MLKKELLTEPIEHIDITGFDAIGLIESMSKMSFSARELATASKIFDRMISDESCTVVLALAGSTSAGGCMAVYHDMIRYNMVDVVVATGASIVDMDFFEAIGFRHFRGSTEIDDGVLREAYVDRIYDTFIDENQLQECDSTIKEIADLLPGGAYSSRELIREMGRYLVSNSKKKDSLVQIAYENNVPIFCPAFSDSSAGFGLVKHQTERPSDHVSIDSVKDFRELTKIKINVGNTGLLIIGGGVPKNFIQDVVICAEVLGKDVPMHKYAVQITVADSRDGACSSSTLKEARSWGKVEAGNEQMVFCEGTIAVPILASYAYHRGHWKDRRRRNLAELF
ncbi:Deoxyhypusine synthase-like protein [Syntrophobacter sp. SbD1]|nr:Deoxyhypusine synthase-like protein [Syntrophobacter sp. SbD1]